MKTLKFAKQFLQHPSQTGALNPSSHWLAKQIVETACLKPDSVIVEFGPGNGIFTEEIARFITPENTFFSVEINEEFAEATRTRCPDVKVIHGSAADTKSYLEEMGHTHCDRIISGLPWAVFDGELQDTLLDAIIEALGPGGRLVTFAYLQGVILPGGLAIKRKLKKRFKRMGHSPVVWRNVPPAFVYWAEV